MFSKKRTILTMTKSLVFVAATLMLSSCSSGGLDETYSDKTGNIEVKFESGGKVYTTAMGVEIEYYYEVDGDKIKVMMGPDGQGPRQIWTLQDDGSLSGPMGVKLTKKD